MFDTAPVTASTAPPIAERPCWAISVPTRFTRASGPRVDLRVVLRPPVFAAPVRFAPPRFAAPVFRPADLRVAVAARLAPPALRAPVLRVVPPLRAAPALRPPPLRADD